MAPTFTSLPTEITDLIVQALPRDDQNASAINLAVTSRRNQAIVEKVLWRKLFVRTGRQCERVWNSLRARPLRFLAVHEVELRAQFLHEVGLQKLVRILERAHNVQRLTIESSACRNRIWSVDGNWPCISRDINSLLNRSAPVAPHSFAAAAMGLPLQRLKRLEIHSNGDRSRF